MSVILSFTSPSNPPQNIVQFQIERSVRSSSGTITGSGDVNNITKVVNVTFDAAVTAGILAGDQMEIGGLVYTILTNTTNSITFKADVDLSTITSFPATFITINDLAEFGSFEIVGNVTPLIPFQTYQIFQFNDATGTIFDFYRIKTLDSGGNVSNKALTAPFRPGQVVTLSVDDKRVTPKDSLRGVIGGAMTFEVEVIMSGRRQDPKDNVVIGQIFMASNLAPGGVLKKIAQLNMTRVGLARYQATWNIPTMTQDGTTVYPSDDYLISYQGNFVGLVDSSPDDYQEFANEYFGIDTIAGPIYGRFPAYATLDDLRMTFFEIDAYLPESVDKIDVEGRNKVLQYHLETASNKLNEELNLHQVRSNSMDRREYVAARSIYTLLLAARGQNSSAISDGFVEHWRNRAVYILDQLKREGAAQGVPLGRG